MPIVEVSIQIAAPLADAWRAVNDIESYPRYMDSVQAVEVLEHVGDRRVSTWSVLLKGSILEWTEEEHADEAAHTITFHQVDGDLDKFDGCWRVEVVDDRTTAIALYVEFEIGIPLLAEMLNPVAARALTQNSEQMLRGIEQRVTLA